ncbi:MAG: glycosyltransferase [Nitrososphaeria archaeon]
MKLLALIPSFYGRTGDAVNERKLILALSRKIEKSYVVTFVSFKQVFTKRRREIKEVKNLPKNITIIPLPLLHVTPILVYFGMVSTSCFMSIIGLVLCWLRKIDLIYIRNSFLSIGFLSFKPLAKRTVVKIPAIIEGELSNGIITRFCITRLALLMDRLVLAKAVRVAIPSRSLYSELVKRRFLKHKHVPLEIPPGVDLRLIEKIKSQLDSKSRRDTLNIGFIGSLKWWQGVDILAQAATLLKRKVSNLKLVIIGDGELKPLIERVCKTSNIPYEITGFLLHEEALRRLRMLDVMVLSRRRTTTTESNIPIKVIEAWALGIPVIVTKHKVFLDSQIRNYEDVIYCEPEPNSVANAIYLLITNDKLRKKLESNGPRLARQFDYERIAEKLLKVCTVE